MRFRFLYSLAIFAGVHAGGDDNSESSVDASASVSASATVSDRLLAVPASTSYSPSYPTYSQSCDWYTDCYSCLGNPSCLWDPNTITGSCKPSAQCDFTYQPRELVLSASVSAAPPATACVRSISQCGQRNFNGAPLNLNPQRGVGCTNHGQCGANQYCYSCSKCVGSCGSCNTGAFPASGMCGPAYRCPIDGDSISGTCPIVGGTYPPVVTYPTSSCNYYSCSSCTAAYGCIWSGSTCYYSSTPCSGYGCANTPDQCWNTGVTYPPTYPTSSCNYYSCSSCTAAYGCVWSGSSCYYSTTPCTGYSCANTPDQCWGGGGVVTYPSYPTSSCNYYSCSSCTAAYGCIWSGSSCYYSTVPCSGYGCANTPNQCYNSYPWSSSYSTSYYATPTYTGVSYHNPWG